MLNEPTIIIKYTTDMMEALPDIYIKSLEEAIQANAGNNTKLEEIRLKLVSCRAVVDNLQYQIQQEKHGMNRNRVREDI